MKKFPSSIRCRDLNSQPVEHESPPITTRPGLPPYGDRLWMVVAFHECRCIRYRAVSYGRKLWYRAQCDQIWQFIGLWATFLSLRNNKFAQISHILRQFLLSVKIYHFYREIIFGQLFIDIWRFFSGHTDRAAICRGKVLQFLRQEDFSKLFGASCQKLKPKLARLHNICFKI